MQASVGRPVVIAGPNPIRGLLRSIEVDRHDTAHFTIEIHTEAPESTEDCDE